MKTRSKISCIRQRGDAAVEGEITHARNVNGRSYRVWFVFSDGHVGLLCTRRSQRVVHLRVRWSVRARVHLWFPARGMAVRRGRSDLGARRGSPRSTQEQGFKLTHCTLLEAGLRTRRLLESLPEVIGPKQEFAA